MKVLLWSAYLSVVWLCCLFLQLHSTVHVHNIPGERFHQSPGRHLGWHCMYPLRCLCCSWSCAVTQLTNMQTKPEPSLRASRKAAMVWRIFPSVIDFRLAQWLLLQEVNVTIISNEVCINSSWGNQINRSAFTISRVYRFSFPIFLLSAHVCAIDSSATGKDSCLGDSGGPLFLLENGRYIHTHWNHKNTIPTKPRT